MGSAGKEPDSSWLDSVLGKSKSGINYPDFEVNFFTNKVLGHLGRSFYLNKTKEENYALNFLGAKLPFDPHTLRH